MYSKHFHTHPSAAHSTSCVVSSCNRAESAVNNGLLIESSTVQPCTTHKAKTMHTSNTSCTHTCLNTVVRCTSVKDSHAIVAKSAVNSTSMCTAAIIRRVENQVSCIAINPCLPLGIPAAEHGLGLELNAIQLELGLQSDIQLPEDLDPGGGS